jgi:hypothetical protein
MSTNMKQGVWLAVVGGLVVISGLAGFGLSPGGGTASPAGPQAAAGVAERRVEVLMGGGGRLSAVWLQKITVGGQEIQCGLSGPDPEEPYPVVPFEAGEDWLKDMTIHIYNRTEKKIAWLDMSLAFPETGNGRTEPQWIYNMVAGRVPAVDAFNGRTGEPMRIDPKSVPLSLLPHRVLELHVGDYFNQIEAYVGERMPLAQITQCVIRMPKVIFDDGMRWSASEGYAVPDPEHPGRFKSLDPNYCPGGIMGRPPQRPQR